MNKYVVPAVIAILVLGVIAAYAAKSNNARKAAATSTPTAEAMMHDPASPSTSPSAMMHDSAMPTASANAMMHDSPSPSASPSDAMSH